MKKNFKWYSAAIGICWVISCHVVFYDLIWLRFTFGCCTIQGNFKILNFFFFCLNIEKTKPTFLFYLQKKKTSYSFFPSFIYRYVNKKKNHSSTEERDLYFGFKVKYLSQIKNFFILKHFYSKSLKKQKEKKNFFNFKYLLFKQMNFVWFFLAWNLYAYRDNIYK